MNIFSKDDLIKNLLINQISITELSQLRKVINEEDLALIIRKIYDLGNEQINKIAALAPVMAKVDALKNSRRNTLFFKKVKGTFRTDIKNKVILAEGDSWFNYPVLLSDVIDWISMEDNLAVYSLASGGDWLMNMISAKKYIEHLSIINPDVFLISGGGNDLVGSNRLAAMVDPTGNSLEYNHNIWAQSLIAAAGQRSNPPLFTEDRFKNGLKYISKDFFALLMFFHLQYSFIFTGILEGGPDVKVRPKFGGIKIITQGYDYALASKNKAFGINPLKWYRPFARLFLGHGTWIKQPLELRGIADKAVQRDVIYAMIFLFNEMMITTGDIFNHGPSGIRVSHIDSREVMGAEGWTDELHPLPANFKRIGKTFIDCINNSQPGQAIFQVSKLYPKN